MKFINWLCPNILIVVFLILLFPISHWYQINNYPVNNYKTIIYNLMHYFLFMFYLLYLCNVTFLQLSGKKLDALISAEQPQRTCHLSKGLLCVLGRIVLLSGGGCPPNYLGCVSVSRAVCASFVNSFTYIFVWSMLITNSNSNLSQWQSQKRNPQPRRNGRSTTRPSTESITPVIE